MKKQMRALFLVYLCLAALQTATYGQSENQVFDTKLILPPNVLQATDFRIAAQTTVKDYEFQFNLETNYGVFPVSGIPLLEKRISEIRAIEEAVSLSKETVALNSAWDILKKTPQGAGHLLSDPKGTLAAYPRGIGRMAANFVDPAARRVGTESKRRLAANLGVDSETRNVVLKQVLDQLSRRNFIGSAATKFALGAVIPGLGTLSTMEKFREQVASQNPHELLQQVDQELIRLGVWPPAREEFIATSRWTLVEKITFMHFFRQLTGIEQSGVMIHMANQDRTETEILRRLIEMQLMVELHSQSPIKTISDGGLPIAWLNNGEIVGVCSVDFLTNSADVQYIAAGFRKANPDAAITLLSTGWLSSEAQKTLDSHNIVFKRASFSGGDRNQAQLPISGQRQ